MAVLPLNISGRGSQPTIAYRLASKLAFSKIKEALGLNKCHGFYAAAAPMALETLNYFLSIDIRILEIYGNFGHLKQLDRLYVKATKYAVIEPVSGARILASCMYVDHANSTTDLNFHNFNNPI